MPQLGKHRDIQWQVGLLGTQCNAQMHRWHYIQPSAHLEFTPKWVEREQQLWTLQRHPAIGAKRRLSTWSTTAMQQRWCSHFLILGKDAVHPVSAALAMWIPGDIFVTNCTTFSQQMLACTPQPLAQQVMLISLATGHRTPPLVPALVCCIRVCWWSFWVDECSPCLLPLPSAI